MSMAKKRKSPLFTKTMSDVFAHCTGFDILLIWENLIWCVGDRPIEITLLRAWDALSWRKRLQLLWLLLQSRGGGAADIGTADVEAMKDDDVIMAAVKEFSSTLPEVGMLYVRVILYEFISPGLYAGFCLRQE